MYCPDFGAPNVLGSGEVSDRYAVREHKPLPWYFDSTLTTYAATAAILLIIGFGFLLSQ